MGKTEYIVETMKAEILNGKYPPGAHFPSEYELAVRFEVNGKTANKAVTLLVAAGLLERGTRGQGTRVCRQRPAWENAPIIFLGSVKNEYYAQVLEGIQSRAAREGVFTVYLSPQAEELQNKLETLAVSHIRGIITHGYGKLPYAAHPVIYIDLVPEAPECHIITGDNYQAGRDAVNALLSRGHRDIVGFFYAGLMPGRRQGVLDAMLEAGIADARERIFEGLSHGDYDTRNFLNTMKRRYPGYTAVVAGTDNIALNIVRNLPAISPEKVDRLGLIGFGNLSGVAELVRMATLDQHPFRLGVAAAERLLAPEAKRGAGTRIYEQIPMELVRADNIPLLLPPVQG